MLTNQWQSLSWANNRHDPRIAEGRQGGWTSWSDGATRKLTWCWPLPSLAKKWAKGLEEATWANQIHYHLHNTEIVTKDQNNTQLYCRKKKERKIAGEKTLTSGQPSIICCEHCGHYRLSPTSCFSGLCMLPMAPSPFCSGTTDSSFSAPSQLGRAAYQHHTLSARSCPWLGTIRANRGCRPSILDMVDSECPVKRNPQGDDLCHKARAKLILGADSWVAGFLFAAWLCQRMKGDTPGLEILHANHSPCV